MSFYQYLLESKNQIAFLLVEHIQLTVIAVLLAILLGVPLGILISYVQRLCKVVLGSVNVIQAVPSLALLGLAIPLLGIGKLPAVIVVMLYSLLPIVKNTNTGLTNINPDTIEAAQGIGLTGFQILTKVQIPLALPVIMAGVRIAAVTAVGLMTIAAFIGAGGLGFLVFSGISTVNNNLIVAGAVPACILALVVDFVVGQIEKKVSPSYAVEKEDEKKAGSYVARFAVGVAALLLIVTVGYSSFIGTGTSKNTVVVGGKDFTEQHIMTHLLAELMDHTLDVPVERKVNLGGTQVCFNAIKSGDLDMYIDYTGTAYADTLGYQPISDVEKVYETVKKDFSEKFDIRVLHQMNFNNTYTLSTTKEIAEKYSLASISDLRGSAGTMVTGLTFEFLNREDGLPGLQKTYDFKFKENKAINGSQRYVALDNKEVQIIDAFATDGLLKKFNLVTLTDDKQFFPPYYAIPLVRAEVIEKHPEIVPQLEKLGELLTDETVTDLNYQVDELQRNPKDVAIEFLEKSGLLD